ncbi:MAG: polysaccharide biosynthesis protein, partial [Planctomycetota bacterium]|nr:polysaccharide biosynthesis protein [Planctomycetota bacterium]
MNLLKATTIATVLTVLVNRFVLPQESIPRGVFLLDWGTTIVIIGGARALLRLLHEGGSSFLYNVDRIPAFIVGANDAGESLLRTIIRDGSSTYRVVGFIDDNRRRLGARIGGVRVVGTIEQTCHLALRRGVQEVLIASGELSGRQIRNLVENTRRHGINVKVLPSFKQLIKGHLAIHPRPVAIDDLLQRKSVELDMKNIHKWIDHRTLMVTGSAGSIGSEICRQLLKYSPKRLVLVDRSENGQFFLDRELRQMYPDVELDVCIADILDQKRISTVLEEYQPDVIFHAAAYKHVPLMEDHPGEAVKNIVAATRRLADLAMTHGVESFVMISTDKAVNPTSVMGVCKRVAEL